MKANQDKIQKASQEPGIDSVVQLSTKGYADLVGCEDGENLYWTTDLNVELPVKMARTGVAAEIKPETIAHVFLRTASERGSGPAMRVQRGGNDLLWTWDQYRTDAVAFAKGLQKMAVDERSVVNIMGFNSPEWAITFTGAILGNTIVSGVYTTNGAAACQYQAQHSEAQVIVVETLQHLELYLSVLDTLPAVKAILVWGVDRIPPELQKDSRVMTFRAFLALGSDMPDSALDAGIAKQRPGQCVCLIYTSGTTGNPKGVMLSHDNLLFSAASATADVLGSLPEGQAVAPAKQRIVSYLPLSHIAGLQFDVTGHLIFGCEVFYAKPDALQGTLVETLNWARPTMFLAVPRVWEKFEDKLKAIAATKPSIMQSISGWAKSHGYEKVMAQQRGGEPSFMYGVANFLILKRIKQAIGLDQVDFFFYGAAPLKQSSVDYFASLDMPLLNMYGLSETTGTTTVAFMNDFSLKHAGKTLSGGHIRIADPDEKGQGEIQVKGRHVMLGYLKNRTATLDCMTTDGYFKTGDQGLLENGGFLKITGRIKELIITAGGENVAPVPIEDNFKAECPVCSNIMLIGENRRFMAALITLKADMDMKTGLPSTTLLPETAEFLKKNVGITAKTTTEAVNTKELAAYVQKCIEATNAKSVSRAAHIKKFVVLDTDFSQPGGELTPTMKLKRKVTEQKYQTIVEGLYAAQAKL